MFEIHIGTTPCELTPKDYRTLAIRSEGYVCDTCDTTSRQLPCLTVTLVPISPLLCATLLCNLSAKSSPPHTLNLFSPIQTRRSLNGRHAHLATRMPSKRTGRRSRATNCKSHHYVSPTLSSRWRVYGQRSARRISESMKNGPKKAVSPVAALISYSG